MPAITHKPDNLEQEILDLLPPSRNMSEAQYTDAAIGAGLQMKAIFTVHEGEFLAGDYINRELGDIFDVWVPSKDSGVDLLLTTNGGRNVKLQVKYSRDFHPDEKLLAGSWFKLNPDKIRQSEADFWVFVIYTFKKEKFFVVVPTNDLIGKIPDDLCTTWHLYLNLPIESEGGGCKDYRDKKKAPVDYSPYLGNWASIVMFARSGEMKQKRTGNSMMGVE